MDFTFIIDKLPVFALGAVMTIELTVLSIIFGSILGLIAALAKISKKKPLVYAASFYTWIIRGTPLLVQLYFIYYGLPKVGIELDPFPAAVIGMSICGGAYITEIIRAGIESIDKGQMEAARSLGMSYLQAMRRVIIPQALRRMLPPMGNEFIALLKDSSLVSTIAMVELMRTATQINAATFKSIEAFFAAGVFYLFLTTIFTVIFNRLEHKLSIN
ncbi:MAG: L-cystine transport system permease protein [Thermosediminibacterales bacterium]|nr:L-cystine transport system permease protein [Thermosediminibacterales bacterium]